MTERSFDFGFGTFPFWHLKSVGIAAHRPAKSVGSKSLDRSVNPAD
jgi:hypothetical protein